MVFNLIFVFVMKREGHITEKKFRKVKVKKYFSLKNELYANFSK